MKKRVIVTTVYESNTVKDFSRTEQQLIKEAKNIVMNAYAPYSEFCVGAAVLLENGEIVSGTNQENAAYPSGICAERVAIFYANSKFPDIPVIAIAICAFYNKKYVEHIIPPCGSCRQVILETETRFKKPIKVLMIGKDTVTIVNDAKELLPLTFDENFLA